MWDVNLFKQQNFIFSLHKRPFDVMFYLNTRSIQIISASHMFPGLSRRESVSECPCLAAWEDWPAKEWEIVRFGLPNHRLSRDQTQSDAGEKYALSLDSWVESVRTQ